MNLSCKPPLVDLCSQSAIRSTNGRDPAPVPQPEMVRDSAYGAIVRSFNPREGDEREIVV